ncbi:MAG: cation-transporting P-type ATPase [Lacrimispora sphenoides]
MNKKQKRANARKISESFTRRERANETIAFAAANELETVLQQFNASLGGLSEKEVIASRSYYGENKVTREKKKTLP